MTRTGTPKVTLALAALFLFGGVCGYAISNRQTDIPASTTSWEERWTDLRLQEDIERLKLTPEQVAQARPSYDQLLSDIRRLREQTARGLFRAVSDQGRALTPQLSPEQREEFLKLTEERRARFRRK